ncbi:MAG: DegV family protein, partial [Oscillospiraceae bacterium]
MDDLHYLHRGGRVSKMTAILGTALGIKPTLHMDDEGRLINVGKVRGRKPSLNWLVDKMAERIGNYKNDVIYISHGDCEDDAKYVGDLVKKRFGIKNVVI